MQELSAFIHSIPPITRWLLLLSICIPVASRIGFVSPYLLIFSWKDLKHFQLWRLLTPFFFSAVNLNYLYALFVRYTYSNMLESASFSSQEEDYLFFLLISCICILIGGSLVGLKAFWSSLNICIVYLWSKLNSERQVSFMFGIQFKAFYLPFAMALIDLITGASYWNSVIGIGASHLYYFGQFVYPTSRNGKKLFCTPSFLKSFYASLCKQPIKGQTKFVRSVPSGYTVYEPTNVARNFQSTSTNKFQGKGRKLE